MDMKPRSFLLLSAIVLSAFLAACSPSDVRRTIRDVSTYIQERPDSALSVLEEIDPRGPVFLWDGASIPVVSALRHVSGAAPLLVGWGQPQDRIHAPNESYGLDQFTRSMEWSAKLLPALV